MSKKINPYYLLFLWIFLTLSCVQTAYEVKQWMDTQSIEDISGEYHLLENDGIKIYLPDVFERYSAVEYQTLLDSIVSKEDFEYESRRLKILREAEGNFYIFYDEGSRSTYTINTMPYMPFTKTDAKFLLGIINRSYEDISRNSDLNITKLTAKYKQANGQQIFRSIHKVDYTDTLATVYSATYIITHKNKTVYIQLATPFEVDFDMFIEKMIM